MSHTVIGLVGGIASGKSTVAALFAALHPGLCVDADALARRLLQRPTVAGEIARRIPQAVGREGIPDPERLAQVVFRNRKALKTLEEITHPRIMRAVRSAIRRAQTPFVYLDAALLQEAGADAICDRVVYVACPARTRRRRAVEQRGWTAAEHARREARQWPCAKKRARADFVVDNGGALARTLRDVRRALRAIERKG